MQYDELDGRDPLIRQHYKNRKDMVTKVSAAEEQLKDYTDPWGKAFYSRFDDLEPIRVAEYEAYVKGEPGCRKWKLPVTAVEHHTAAAAWYDQYSLGDVLITEVPTSDGGSEYWISIKPNE